VSARRRMRDPDGFHRLTDANGVVQAAARSALGGPYDALGAALEGWLHAARVDYAATDFDAVRRDVANLRALHAELTVRSSPIRWDA
jgi:hypothetical protein